MDFLRSNEEKELERVADSYNVHINDSRLFKTKFCNMVANPLDTITTAFALLNSESVPAYRKRSCFLLLKILLQPDLLEDMLKDDIAPWDRDDPRVRAWTVEVKKAGKCAVCGSTENLEAHHILKWSEYPAGRIDPENGVCLCRNCHADSHKGDLVENLIRKCRRKKARC